MKKLIVLFFLSLGSLLFSQAYDGKGDMKLQVGINFQENATGWYSSVDYGLADNISVGIGANYLTWLNSDLKDAADFTDRFDIMVRGNANLGNVIGLDERMDVYPGLHIGLRNFGGHLGARYFFSDGFGIYTELHVPFQKYNTDDLNDLEKLNNNVAFHFGMAFNL